VRRLLVHDRGRVMADLACAIAGGAWCGNTTEPAAWAADIVTAWDRISALPQAP